MAVRWYLRYGLSYRDVEKLRGERGELTSLPMIGWVVRSIGPGDFDAESVVVTRVGSRLLLVERPRHADDPSSTAFAVTPGCGSSDAVDALRSVSSAHLQ